MILLFDVGKNGNCFDVCEFTNAFGLIKKNALNYVYPYYRPHRIFAN
jgi:hypothetical protein